MQNIIILEKQINPLLKKNDLTTTTLGFSIHLENILINIHFKK